MLTNLLLVIHLIVAVAIVILVLLQRGKGADMGAAFGGGSSQSLFGARGSANFLSRATAGLVTVFFLSSLTLAYIYTHQGESGSVTAGAPALEAPADDAPPDVPDEYGVEDPPADDDIPAAPE